MTLVDIVHNDYQPGSIPLNLTILTNPTSIQMQRQQLQKVTLVMEKVMDYKNTLNSC